MRRVGASVILLLATAGMLGAAGKKKALAESYALVSGTVFREPGFALPGADVTLVPDPEPGQPAAKIKKLQAVSDARGEFAFRVPPAAMRYKVFVAAKGYNGEEKSASVQGEERVEVTFLLRAESK